MAGPMKVLMKAAITVAIFALAACNPVANLNAGDSQIAKFHAAYSRGDGDAIYAMTGPQFRATTSRAQIEELLDVFEVRLGAVKSSERTGFNVNTNTAGTFTTIVMSTHFAKGDGQENFLFSGQGDEMKLEGWHVNSPRLMLTADDIADERADASPAPVMVQAAPAQGAPQD